MPRDQNLSDLLKIGGRASRWNPDLTLQSRGHGEPDGNYSYAWELSAYTRCGGSGSHFCCASVPHLQDEDNNTSFTHILSSSVLSYYKKFRHVNNFMHVSNLIDLKGTIQRCKVKQACKHWKDQGLIMQALWNRNCWYLLKFYTVQRNDVSNAKLGFF